MTSSRDYQSNCARKRSADCAPLLLALVIGTASGCFEAGLAPNCAITCGGDGRCPDSMTCSSEGLCTHDPPGTCASGAQTDHRPEKLRLPESAPPVGNLLTYSFQDDPKSYIVLDRSGNSRHADAESLVFRTATDELLGERNFVYFDSGWSKVYVAVPDHEELFLTRQMTLEVWLRPSQWGTAQPIFGDWNETGFPEQVLPTYIPRLHVEITPDDSVVVTTGHCEQGLAERVEISFDVNLATLVAADTWFHLALLWDADKPTEQMALVITSGEEQHTFYAETGHNPCPASQPRPYYLGYRDSDTTVHYQGGMDNFSLSNYARSKTTLARSRAMQDSELMARCGDGITDVEELCDLGGGCCRQCRPMTAPIRCGDGSGTCNAGACEIGGGRVSGAEVLYDFVLENGAQPDIITDRSQVTPAIDLMINDADSTVEWLPGRGLKINAETIARTTEVPQRLIDECTKTNELTVEAWLTPETDLPDPDNPSPRRIVTLSNNTTYRAFTLGQTGDRFVLRLVSSRNVDDSMLNGAPIIPSSPGAVVPGQLTHVVVARRNEGTMIIYVNGVPQLRENVPGAFAPRWFARQHHLAVGNEVSYDPTCTVGLCTHRPWLGTLWLVAIYCHSLSAEEVARNYAAGPAPDLSAASQAALPRSPGADSR